MPQNESMQTLDVLDSLLERDLVKHYSFESRSLEKKLEKSSLRDSGFHFFNYRYAGLKNRYFLQQKERRHDPQLEKNAGTTGSLLYCPKASDCL
jgi:hypothetical protein